MLTRIKSIGMDSQFNELVNALQSALLSLVAALSFYDMLREVFFLILPFLYLLFFPLSVGLVSYLYLRAKKQRMASSNLIWAFIGIMFILVVVAWT